MIDSDDTPPPMRVAIKESYKSNHRFKLGACIAKGKRILSKAHNSRKTHPEFGAGNFQTLHAESYAIYKAVRQGISLKGATLYVYRRNNNLAKPCPCCMGLIHKYGIKKVIYSGCE
jgi:deoxycytidylate deaminase